MARLLDWTSRLRKDESGDSRYYTEGEESESQRFKSIRGYPVFSEVDMMSNPERYGWGDSEALARGNPDGYYISDRSGNLRFMGPFRTIEAPRTSLRNARRRIRR